MSVLLCSEISKRATPIGKVRKIVGIEGLPVRAAICTEGADVGVTILRKKRGTVNSLWQTMFAECNLTIQGIIAALKMVNLSPRDSKKKLGSVHFCFFVMVYIVQSTLLKARTHLWGWHAQKTDTYSRSLPIDLLRFRIPWRLVSVVSNCTLGRFGDAITSVISCYEVAPETGSKDPVVQLDTTPSQSAEPNGNMSTSQWQTLSTRRSRHSNWLLVLVVATLQ